MVSSSPIRIVYFGTPAYAVPAMRALASDPRFDVRLVVTQPDRPAGRGHRLIAPPVKETALELRVPVIQPETLRDLSVREQLGEVDADLFVVAAYGRIFSQAILDMPRHGCLNLHASILPKYRGAAPVAAAILNGDATTGVTLMMMERGLDTGPVVACRETVIDPTATTETLTARLADIGAQLALDKIPDMLSGAVAPVPQPRGGSIVRQLVKADGAIDWSNPAELIERQVRAMWPWPRASTAIEEVPFQIHRAVVRKEVDPPLPSPGSVILIERRPAVACCDGSVLEIEAGQASGGRVLSGPELVQGRVFRDGQVLSSLPGPSEPLVQPVAD